MKSFDIKTKVYFGDNALDRLQRSHIKKYWLLQTRFWHRAV